MLCLLYIHIYFKRKYWYNTKTLYYIRYVHIYIYISNKQVDKIRVAWIYLYTTTQGGTKILCQVRCVYTLLETEWSKAADLADLGQWRGKKI